MAAPDQIKIKEYKAGSAVVIQNAPNLGFFYIVKSGVLAIDSEHRLEDKVLSRFEPGDSFGIVSALTGHHFLVTIYAQTNATVIEIPVSMLGQYLKNQKSLALKMIRLYSRELRSLQKHLSVANTPSEQAAGLETLYLNSAIYESWGKENYAQYALTKYIEQAGQTGVYYDRARDMIKKYPTPYAGPQWPARQSALAQDEILFLDGERSKDIYILLAGSVKLFKVIRGHEFVIDVLGPGELFGEMSFIDDAPRMGSAVTLHESTILRLNPDDLLDSIAGPVLQKVFVNLARRIWFSHQRLIILRISDPPVRLFAFMYNMIRNQALKSGQKHVTDREYTFDLTFEDLKTMCGLFKISNDKLKIFTENTNILISENTITIKSKKRLEDQIAFYKAKSGQIIAESI